MTSLEIPTEVRLHLYGLGKQKYEPHNKYAGICDEIDHEFGRLMPLKATMEAIGAIMKEWPKCSGHASYPVPDPTLELDPGGIYIKFQEEKISMWGETPYGKLRLELCLFIATYIGPKNEKPVPNPLTEEVRQWLLSIANSSKYPLLYKEGLLQNILNRYDFPTALHAKAIAEHWPKYSGNPNYPVPNPYKDCPPEQFYKRLEKYNINIWLGASPHSQLLRELCLFIANWEGKN